MENSDFVHPKDVRWIYSMQFSSNQDQTELNEVKRDKIVVLRKLLIGQKKIYFAINCLPEEFLITPLCFSSGLLSNQTT